MALYTPVKIVVMDCDNERLFHNGGVCGAQSTASSGNVGNPWLLRPCTTAQVRRAMQQVLRRSACI